MLLFNAESRSLYLQIEHANLSRFMQSFLVALLKTQADFQDQPQLRYLQGGYGISEIVAAAGEIYRVEESVLLKARSRAGGACKFLAYCLRGGNP